MSHAPARDGWWFVVGVASGCGLCLLVEGLSLRLTGLLANWTWLLLIVLGLIAFRGAFHLARLARQVAGSEQGQ